jgi:hypothetical protein
LYLEGHRIWKSPGKTAKPSREISRCFRIRNHALETLELSEKSSRYSAPAVAALLILHALLLAWSAAKNSATFDEPAHLAAGSEYWVHHDFSIYSLSPPLLRLWAAAPAVLAGASVPDPGSVQHLPIHDRHWYYADGFVYANFSRFPFLLMISRWGMIPISCLAGWLVFCWSRRLYGSQASLAACAIYCLCPSILAHGSLVTTDIGAATAILFASWQWWLFCQKPTAPRWILVCIALVLAHLCKFTAILLWPMMLAMAVPLLAQPPLRRKTILLGFIGSAAMTLLILNALYGFAGTGQPFGSFHFYSDSMQNLQRHLPHNFPSPLPRLLVQGMDAQKYDTQSRYSGFLFGQKYPSTIWYFYPVALLCKLPVSMLLLGAAALMSMLTRRGRLASENPAAETSMLEAGFVFLAGVAILSDVNIGTRYLLPAFPLCIIPISRLWIKAGGRHEGTKARAEASPSLRHEGELRGKSLPLAFPSCLRAFVPSCLLL